MAFERPAKGNPHRFTIRQHTMPAASLDRFSNDSGLLEVALRPFLGNHRNLRAGDACFCAKRTWDQHAESVLMKEIEDRFQDIAETTLSGSMSAPSAAESLAISEYLRLCNLRAYWRESDPLDADLRQSGAIDVEHHLTKQEQEMLELNDIGFVRPDLSIPSRISVGAKIRIQLLRGRREARILPWRVVHAIRGTLVLPDRVTCPFLPLAPTVAFTVAALGASLGFDQVRFINQIAVSNAARWYAARRLNDCPT